MEARIHQLVVEGDMRARDVYSLGAIRVGGQLDVAGVLMTVYNDFTFEVDGAVNARLLLVSDMSNKFRSGRVQIAHDPLLAQLVAARPGLAPGLSATLAALNDPQVDLWLRRQALEQRSAHDSQPLAPEEQ